MKLYQQFIESANVDYNSHKGKDSYRSMGYLNLTGILINYSGNGLLFLPNMSIPYTYSIANTKNNNVDDLVLAMQYYVKTLKEVFGFETASSNEIIKLSSNSALKDELLKLNQNQLISNETFKVALNNPKLIEESGIAIDLFFRAREGLTVDEKGVSSYQPAGNGAIEIDM